jgi:hypothetical protein
MTVKYLNTVLVHLLVHANLPGIIRGTGVHPDPQIMRKTLKSKEQGAREGRRVGLGSTHSHLSPTWTLAIPCWILDILPITFVTHEA